MWRSEEDMLAQVQARAGHLRRRRRRRGVLLSTAAATVAIVVAVVTLSGGGVHTTRVNVNGRPPAPTPSTATTPGTGGAPIAGQAIQQLTPVGADVVWASTDQATSATPAGPVPQGIVRSPDGGESWQVVTPPGLAVATGGRYILAADFVDANHAWVTYGGVSDNSPHTLIATSDGGRTWATIGRLPAPYCTVQFVNVADGWCVDVAGAMGADAVDIDRTTDGGRHWSLISNSATAMAPQTPGSPGSLPLECDKRVTFLTATLGWAGLDCPVGVSPLYETTDGGRTWVRRAVQTPSSAYGSPEVYPSAWTVLPETTGATGAAGFSVGATVSLVYRTDDGGASWQPVAPPGAPQNWDVQVIDATDWKCISGRTLLATDNAGRTWRTTISTIALSSTGSLSGGLDFVTPLIGWYVVGPGRTEVLRTTDGGATWQNVAVPGVGA